MNPHELSPFELGLTRWYFGWVSSDELPALAALGLTEGLDSPALVQLAATEADGDPDLHRLFQTALSELGRTSLSKTSAGLTLAKEVAQRIVDGRISPIDGARAIWEIAADCDELTSDLGIFVGRVDEYDEIPEIRDQVLEDIAAEARILTGPAGR